MDLKTHILTHVARDALEVAAYGLGLDGIDTSDQSSLADDLRAEEAVTAQSLLVWLQEDELRLLCETAQIPSLGGRSRLIGNLLRLETDGHTSTVEPTGARGERSWPLRGDPLPSPRPRRSREPLRLQAQKEELAPRAGQLRKAVMVAIDFETADYGPYVQRCVDSSRFFAILLVNA